MDGTRPRRSLPGPRSARPTGAGPAYLLPPAAVARTPERSRTPDAWCAAGGSDHAALRRYLVEERLLTREHGVYQRIDAVEKPLTRH
ncbi:DUF2087 domain-containing protein [Micromonospora sp. NPDC049275]|uniref:DUF2087 domain-containing protein n=1 Tax=Micromonospora sp. NPDC049275 TaxID=3364268 RepID=UPI00371AB032